MSDEYPIGLHDRRIVRASASDPKRIVAIPPARVGTLGPGPYPDDVATDAFSNTVAEADSVVTGGPATVWVIPLGEEGEEG